MTTKITEQNISNLANAGVDWQSVVVADGSTNTTGVSGKGYFIDTSAGAHTINLPASPKIGDIIKVSLITAGNDLTIGRNGNNINGNASDITTSADGDAFELVYVNASEGWKTVGQITAASFTEATGGTITTSSDYKIHSFTGDGCFAVSSAGNGDSNPLGGPNTVDYLVVAGGGGGGLGTASLGGGAGGGAGGYRESSGAASGCYSASPLGSGVPALTISATTYPVTVGAGGTGSSCAPLRGTQGSNSVFSTITSAGGGGGGSAYCGSIQQQDGGPGGSGGGAGSNHPGSSVGGSGNTPPVSPPQGSNGGGPNPGGGWGSGGGGATGTGTAGSPPGGTGGAGGTTSISGSPTAYAGGGGGGVYDTSCGTAGPGGTGGGGDGGKGAAGNPGTANTGGGGGGGGRLSPGIPRAGGTGGKGIVIIRYKYQ